MDQPLWDLSLIAEAPAWSPKEDVFLYRKILPSEQTGIYLAEVGGTGDGERLAGINYVGESVNDPAWLPDGSGFIYLRNEATAQKFNNSGMDLYHYDFKSNTHTSLTYNMNEILGNPSVSPDGKYIVFERVIDNGEQQELWVVDRANTARQWPLKQGDKFSVPDWSRVEPTVPNTSVREWNLY